MTTPTIERLLRPSAADPQAFFHGRYLSVTSPKRDGAVPAIGGETPVFGALIDGGTRTAPHGDPLLTGESGVDAIVRRGPAEPPAGA